MPVCKASGFAWKTVSDPLYRIDVTICVGPVKAYEEFVAERHSNDVDLSSVSFRPSNGKTLQYVSGEWMELYLWFPWSDVTPRTVVHECIHVTSRLMRHVGMPLSDASEEAYCYYGGWIFTQATEFLLECAAKKQRDKSKRHSRTRRGAGSRRK